MTTTKTDTTDCWELIFARRDGEILDGEAHFSSEEEAAAFAADAGLTGWTARQLDEPCITVRCVACGSKYDEDGVAAVHFRSLAETETELQHSGWRRIGDGWQCAACAGAVCDCSWCGEGHALPLASEVSRG